MFHGSIVAIVTPMQENGEIDYASLSKLVDFHIENGTDGIVAMGTTGESATVTPEEHHQVVRHIIEQVEERVPVIAGSGHICTQTAIELTHHAMEMGADAALIMAPAYVKPTQEGLFQHFSAIAHEVAIPQILYNVPGRSACDILPETVERLSHLPNIIGIKEATGNVERSKEILQLCGDRLDVYSGDDIAAKDIVLAGGRGVISVTANVAPRQMHTMIQAALAGEQEKAEKFDNLLQPLNQQLFKESNPIPVKWALHLMGLIPAGIRLPLTPLAEEYRAELASVLKTVGVLTG